MLAIAKDCLARGEFPGVTDHDLEESLSRIAASPETGIVALDAGRLAGWVIPRQFDLTVDPEFRRRGHGTRLVEAGRRLAATDGLPNLRLWSPLDLPGPEAFLRRQGFRYDASMWRMHLPETTPVVEPAFGADVNLRSSRPGIDEPAFVEVANDAFADHPSPVRFSLAGARLAMSRPGFDPITVSLLAPAADPEQLIGFARIELVRTEGGELAGDVHAIGLRRAWRSRGLGRELLRWSVTELRRRHAGDIYLTVEAENSAALRLYETEGFVPGVEWPHWILEL